jgi:murein DD-endopeptidase MepM/ murein hydrolase activator NlpD
MSFSTVFKNCTLNIITILISVFPLLAHASLPKASNVPGGIAIIQLGNILTHKAKPQARFNEQPVLVQADLKQWYAVVGLPLDTAPGRYKLNVTMGDKTKVFTFRVKKKKYPEQHITIEDKGKVELAPEDEARAVREIATIKELKHHWRDEEKTDLGFILPAQGRLSGNFGLRRFFNGQARSPHAGMDVAVGRGTPVMSSAAGTVLAVEDYFFNGKTIFVDHGNGLITMYCHLDQFDVHTGDTVSKGQQLGLSGMSGRATGPHLHWSVILNGAMVDPALFIPAKRLK